MHRYRDITSQFRAMSSSWVQAAIQTPAPSPTRRLPASKTQFLPPPDGCERTPLLELTALVSKGRIHLDISLETGP
jgi:hypothetical protein